MCNLISLILYLKQSNVINSSYFFKEINNYQFNFLLYKASNKDLKNIMLARNNILIFVIKVFNLKYIIFKTVISFKYNILFILSLIKIKSK